MKSENKIDRTERIGDLIQQTLAQMLLQDMADPRFRLVTITEVTVAKDLSHAKIFVTILSDEPEFIQQIIKALNRAAKPLRHLLTKKVELRIMPQLKFVYDESTAKGFHISDLIQKAMNKTSNA